MDRSKYILTLSCQDRLGIIAKITSFLANIGAFIVELSQYGDPSTGRFFLRCVFQYEGTSLAEAEFEERFERETRDLAPTWKLHDLSYRPRVLLLVSKEGHCLNDLLHRTASQLLPIDIRAIASNHTTLGHMAAWHDIPFHHLPVEPGKKEAQEAQILKLIREEQIDLVVLARYMQILSRGLTSHLAGRAINIHHSFLPSFKGARPYHQAFERGVKLIGATAHYVSDELDEGPIIEQEVIRVDHAATPTDLVHLGKDIECQVLARALKYHIEERVFINGHRTVIFK